MDLTAFLTGDSSSLTEKAVSSTDIAIDPPRSVDPEWIRLQLHSRNLSLSASSLSDQAIAMVLCELIKEVFCKPNCF